MANDSTTASGAATPATLAGWVLAYSLARMALVVVVAAVIMGIGALVDVKVPLLVAAVFGVLIALPVGMAVFKSLRLKVNEQIAAVDADRAAKRSDLQSRLRGDGR